MTREYIKSKIRMSVVVNAYYIDSIKRSDEIIDHLFDKHEAELKAKDDEIKKIKSEHGYEKCKKCTHYSCGTQPDSFGWEKCGWDWECKSFFEDHFELMGDA